MKKAFNKLSNKINNFVEDYKNPNEKLPSNQQFNNQKQYNQDPNNQYNNQYNQQYNSQYNNQYNQQPQQQFNNQQQYGQDPNNQYNNQYNNQQQFNQGYQAATQYPQQQQQQQQPQPQTLRKYPSYPQPVNSQQPIQNQQSQQQINLQKPNNHSMMINNNNNLNHQNKDDYKIIQQQYYQTNNRPLPKPPVNNNNNINGIPGAHADGIHDDTQAFSEYLNSCTQNPIIIPSGTYLITSSISFAKSNKTILGSSNVKIIGNISNVWNNEPISEGFINTKEYLFVLTGDNIVLDSLVIVNAIDNPKSSSAFYAWGNGFTLKNCSVDNFNQGLCFGKLKDGSGTIPPNSTFTNLTISNNQITNIIGKHGGSICYGDAIAFFGVTHVVISNNFISAKNGFTPRNGLNAGPEGFIRSSDIQYQNNTIRGDWDYAITTEGSDDAVISGNDIQGANICSIIERGKNIKVCDNKIHIHGRFVQGHTESTAIQFYGVDHGEIHGNNIQGTAKYAILVKPSHESAGGNHTSIQFNTIDGDFFNCIYFGNTNHGVIKKNTILGKNKDNGSVGLQLWYANKLEIHENCIDTPQGTACICSGTDQVNVLSNQMMNSRAGFYICRGSKCVRVENNDLKNVKQTKFDQSHDNQDVCHSQNYGIDCHSPTHNHNNNNVNNGNTVNNLNNHFNNMNINSNVNNNYYNNHPHTHQPQPNYQTFNTNLKASS
ncbi:hypothetical protein CYY_000843 [Polysphondylium violaceum]|uniref:Right handed beta helix domain-containing protein n=1 Tax=Polysphondylium violaceum TaxID=133409 RepID=A0A8J4UWT9_9MYCE|nr:hypothetical protein CYY_000843 [Polysphondylium violaceum]